MAHNKWKVLGLVNLTAVGLTSGFGHSLGQVKFLGKKLGNSNCRFMKYNVRCGSSGSGPSQLRFARRVSLIIALL